MMADHYHKIVKLTDLEQIVQFIKNNCSESTNSDVIDDQFRKRVRQFIHDTENSPGFIADEWKFATALYEPGILAGCGNDRGEISRGYWFAVMAGPNLHELTNDAVADPKTRQWDCAFSCDANDKILQYIEILNQQGFNFNRGNLPGCSS